MKVAEVAQRRRRRLSPLKERVLEFLDGHPDEVFPYRDSEVARELNVKASALSFTFWALHRDGLIDKEEVAGKVYFGCRNAIEELRRRLGLTKQDAFETARANRDRIWARTGDIGVLELLDAVRGPWE